MSAVNQNSRILHVQDGNYISGFMARAQTWFERWEEQQRREEAAGKVQRGFAMPRLAATTTGKRHDLTRKEAAQILAANEDARTIYYNHLRRFLTAFEMGSTVENVYSWCRTDPACVRDNVKPQRICATLLRWREKTEAMEANS